ncbi:MAG: dynein light chain Tctex-type family protein [Pseudoalteromonas sp.]|nr:dynein light chain Tctex-type family protein [Pseudoalteromonas sp.]
MLGASTYQHGQVDQWTSLIVEGTLSALTKLNKPYKYIVTCVVMQKSGAGLHLASSCYWDNQTDGSTFNTHSSSLSSLHATSSHLNVVLIASKTINKNRRLRNSLQAVQLCAGRTSPCTASFPCSDAQSDR